MQRIGDALSETAVTGFTLESFSFHCEISEMTHMMISTKKTTTQTQQRPESLTVILTWHASKYKGTRTPPEVHLQLTPLFVDSAQTLWASFCFRLHPIMFSQIKPKMDPLNSKPVWPNGEALG